MTIDMAKLSHFHCSTVSCHQYKKYSLWSLLTHSCDLTRYSNKCHSQIVACAHHAPRLLYMLMLLMGLVDFHTAGIIHKEWLERLSVLMTTNCVHTHRSIFIPFRLLQNQTSGHPSTYLRPYTTNKQATKMKVKLEAISKHTRSSFAAVYYISW